MAGIVASTLRRKAMHKKHTVDNRQLVSGIPPFAVFLFSIEKQYRLLNYMSRKLIFNSPYVLQRPIGTGA